MIQAEMSINTSDSGVIMMLDIPFPTGTVDFCAPRTPWAALWQWPTSDRSYLIPYKHTMFFIL